MLHYLYIYYREPLLTTSSGAIISKTPTVWVTRPFYDVFHPNFIDTGLIIRIIDVLKYFYHNPGKPGKWPDYHSFPSHSRERIGRWEAGLIASKCKGLDRSHLWYNCGQDRKILANVRCVECDGKGHRFGNSEMSM